MAILWCGGEDISFPNGNKKITTDSRYYRNTYSRCGLYGGVFFYGPAFSQITSGWLTFRAYLSGSTTSTYNAPMMGLVGNDGKTGYWLRKTSGKLVISKYDGSSWSDIATESGTSLGLADVGKFDIQISDYGASGTINAYLAGNLLATFTGDLTISGLAGFTRVGGYSNASDGVCVLSEVIVADTDTRNLSLRTNAPNAAGDANNWTGAYTNIDEVTLDDADLIYDNTDGHQFMCGLADTPAGSFSVLAVKAAVRACRASDSTPTSLDIGIKSGGSVDVNDNHSLTTTWATYERLMTANPVTGNAFTPAEVDALQLVLESEA